MKTYTVKHIYCGMIRVISGYDIYSAMKNAGLNFKLWKIA